MVAGAQSLLLVLMEFAFGNIFEGAGISFLDSLVLRLNVVQMFGIGMIDGAGKGLLKRCNLGCILLLKGRIPF